MSFNSKLVRLKAKYDLFALGLHYRFQFQTGSIKSVAVTLWASTDSGFQFQTGSIKSVPKC